MRRLRAVIAVVAGRIFPWPARHERRAAIDRARGEKEASQSRLAADKQVTDSILRMAKENHYAERVARQIMGG